MSTYSINIGQPTESTKKEDLQSFLNNLPDNTAQLISPRDTRDGFFTTWENILIKETNASGSSVSYIGLDTDNIKAKFLLGKKSFTNQNVLTDDLLQSDTDIFVYNNKSDSNGSQQDTKMSFLAGTDNSVYLNAPYIESKKIASPNRLDLEISNPSSGGVVSIYSDNIELGQNGWIINNSGVLYPITDGQDIGATPSNRIGNIYMSSRIDFANELKWTVGTEEKMRLDNTDGLFVDNITSDVAKFENFIFDEMNATSGYVLTSDATGNVTWKAAPGASSQADGVTGSVQFKENGDFEADSDNFYWDNVNKRLGINTNSPNNELTVNGTIEADAFTASVITTNDITIGNTASTTNMVITGTLSYPIGFANGRVMVTDVNGNAIWSENLVLDNSFGNVLRVGNPVSIPNSQGNGIFTDGNLMLQNSSDILFNLYNDTGSYKAIQDGTSFKLSKNINNLQLDIYPSVLANATQTSQKLISFNSKGVGVGVSDAQRELHIDGSMRLDILTTEPVGLTYGEVFTFNNTIDGTTDVYSVTENSNPDDINTSKFKITNKHLTTITAEELLDFQSILVDDVVAVSYGNAIINVQGFTFRRFDSNQGGSFNISLQNNYILQRKIQLKVAWVRNDPDLIGGNVDFNLFYKYTKKDDVYYNAVVTSTPWAYSRIDKTVSFSASNNYIKNITLFELGNVPSGVNVNSSISFLLVNNVSSVDNVLIESIDIEMV